MNLARFFIDQTIKRHIDKEGEFNIKKIAKISRSSTATIWRQLQKSSNLRAETWLKLMRSLNNFDVDLKKFEITIRLPKTDSALNVLTKIKNMDFKREYENGNDNP